MKFCKMCGTAIPEGSTACPNCNTPVEDNASNTGYSNAQQSQNDNSRQSYDNNSSQNYQSSQSYQSSQNYNTSYQANGSGKNSDCFVDPNEVEIASIGSGYLSNLMTGSGVGKGYGVLTDRRFYYSGKVIKGGKKSNEEWTIDLEDITSTGFLHSNPIIWIFICIFAAIGSFGVLAFSGEVASGFVAFIVCIILAVGGYFLFKKTYYVVTCAGMSLWIDTKGMGGVKRLREFNVLVRKAKDAAKNHR